MLNFRGLYDLIADILHGSLYREMNIILLTKSLRHPLAIMLNKKQLVGITMLVVLVFSSVPFYLGMSWGKEEALTEVSYLLDHWKNEMTVLNTQLVSLEKQSDKSLDALTIRIATLQARVIRLDALGGRIVDIAKLSADEFDFNRLPAQGGPQGMLQDGHREGHELKLAIKLLSTQILDKEQQLAAIESVLMGRELHKEVFPAGRPIESGWISSYYGLRTDPFTGKKEHHGGVDFAGAMGAKVIAVAAGVVTWSGKRYGYGNLVEVNHGNGYVSRYAHNKDNLVVVGQAVEKGEVLALMGSSGRSTGPHVHFEVLRHDKAVNPLRYIRAAL